MEEIFDSDIKVKVERGDNNEILIDKNFATTFMINIDEFGEITSGYYGCYNKDILKAIGNMSKSYIKKLSKNLKENKLLEESKIEVKKEEDIPEDNKLKESTIQKETKKDLSKKKKIYNKLKDKSSTKK